MQVLAPEAMAGKAPAAPGTVASPPRVDRAEARLTLRTAPRAGSPWVAPGIAWPGASPDVRADVHALRPRVLVPLARVLVPFARVLVRLARVLVPLAPLARVLVPFARVLVLARVLMPLARVLVPLARVLMEPLACMSALHPSCMSALLARNVLLSLAVPWSSRVPAALAAPSSTTP